MEKKDYSEPDVTDFGTVADLTETGYTNPGADGKTGSAASSGN